MKIYFKVVSSLCDRTHNFRIQGESCSYSDSSIPDLKRLVYFGKDAQSKVLLNFHKFVNM